MNRSGRILAVFLSVCMLVLSACGSTSRPAVGQGGAQPAAGNQPSSGAIDYKGQTLRIMASAWIIDKWPLKDSAAAFEKDHPGVKVEIATAPEQLQGLLLEWSRGKTQADLMLGGVPSDLAPIAAKGVLTEFGDGFFTNGVAKGDFVQPFLKMGQYGGKQLVIPLLGELQTLTVRKDLFQQAGLVDSNGNPLHPKSWDELLEWSKKLQVKEGNTVKVWGLGVDWGTTKMYQNYLAGLQATRGNIYADDKKGIDVSSPEATALVTFWQKALAEGVANTQTMTDDNAARNAFKSGAVASHSTPNSRTQEAQAQLGADKVTWIPFPGAEQNGTLGFIHGAYIPTPAETPEIARVFVREQLLKKENQQWSATKFGKLPTLNRNYDGLPAELKDVVKLADKAVPEPLYVEASKYVDLIQLNLGQAITGKKSIPDAFSSIKSGSANLNLSQQ